MTKKEAKKLNKIVQKSTVDILEFAWLTTKKQATYKHCVKQFEVATEAFDTLHELHLENLLPTDIDIHQISRVYWRGFDRYTAKHEAELS